MKLEADHLDTQRALAEVQARQSRLLLNGASDPAALAELSVPPDPVSGGWPSGTSYFYLPKRVLGSVGIANGLCQSNRLTDDTVVLFGITPTEREAVDAPLDTLWNSFRSLEIQRMEPVEVPGTFSDNVRNAIAYRIPALTNEMQVLRGEFDAAVEAALGHSRAEMMRAAFDDHFQKFVNDLGASTCIIAFGQDSGSEFQRVMVFDETRKVGEERLLDPLNQPRSPDDAIYHYARLLGVELPQPTESEP